MILNVFPAANRMVGPKREVVCSFSSQAKQGIRLFIFQSGKTQGIYLKSLKLSFYTGNLPPTLNKSGMWLQIFDFDSKF